MFIFPYPFNCNIFLPFIISILLIHPDLLNWDNRITLNKFVDTASLGGSGMTMSKGEKISTITIPTNALTKLVPSHPQPSLQIKSFTLSLSLSRWELKYERGNFWLPPPLTLKNFYLQVWHFVTTTGNKDIITMLESDLNGSMVDFLELCCGGLG